MLMMHSSCLCMVASLILHYIMYMYVLCNLVDVDIPPTYAVLPTLL